MKTSSSFLLCMLFVLSSLSGQICEGNLGENIFTNGDFGSGANNILPVNPQIAPGYSYVTTPPPNDGSYTITNNTAQWASTFAGWQSFEDNSSDPFGYMMVVNASFSPGLFYEQEVTGLCDNTLYEFSVDVFNIIEPGSGLILPNVSFLLDGTVLFTTGPVPENAQWNTYGFTFTTEPGQTSLTLSLQNNAPGGIGNDLALDNITFRPCGPEALILPTEVANICEDEDPIDLAATVLGDQYTTPAFQWQQSFDGGITWVNLPGETDSTYTFDNLAGGFYYYRYLLANGSSNLANNKCRVVSNTKIVYVIPKFSTTIDTICNGLSLDFNGITYTETGVYIDSLTNAIGCDSIVTLDLTVVPNGLLDASFSTLNPSCSNVADGSISLLEILNGPAPYQITINGEPSLNAGNLSNIPAGDYRYNIVDNYGCSLETTVTLGAPVPFTVNLEAVNEVPLGEEVIVRVTPSEPVVSYTWDPADIVNCDIDCEQFSLLPTSSGIISLSAVSETNCIATDSIFLNVLDVRKVYIPNVFSPNLDGINDFFTIYADFPNVQMIEKLMVFDRWGAVLFEQDEFLPNSNSLGWDGTVNGREMPTGVYAYVAEIRFLDNQVITYSGDITILR